MRRFDPIPFGATQRSVVVRIGLSCGVHTHAAVEPTSTFALGPSSAHAISVRYRIFAFPLALPVAIFGLYPAWEVFIARRCAFADRSGSAMANACIAATIFARAPIDVPSAVIVIPDRSTKMAVGESTHGQSKEIHDPRP